MTRGDVRAHVAATHGDWTLRLTSGNRPRSPGASKARPDTPWNRANAARRAAHLVRRAPPSGCQHQAARSAQEVDVRCARARGDAPSPSNGSPQPIGVRTGTADSYSPRQTPSRRCQEGAHVPARELPLERTPETCSAPTDYAERESRTLRSVRSRTFLKRFVGFTDRFVLTAFRARCRRATWHARDRPTGGSPQGCVRCFGAPLE
jgi:hypothetical protein